MTVNIKSAIQSVKALYALPHIRNELQFYINRTIIGFIILTVLLFYGIKPNFNPLLILKQHLGLLISILIIFVLLRLIIFITNKFKRNKYIIFKVNNYLINFCCDIITVIISSLVLFIPILAYGIFKENFGIIVMILFVIIFIEFLSYLKEDLKSCLLDDNGNFYFEANIRCK